MLEAALGHLDDCAGARRGPGSSISRAATSCSASTSTVRWAGPWPCWTTTTRRPSARWSPMSRTAASMSPRYGSTASRADRAGLDRARLDVDTGAHDLAERVPQRRLDGSTSGTAMPNGLSPHHALPCASAGGADVGEDAQRGRAEVDRTPAPPDAAAAQLAPRNSSLVGDQVVRPGAHPLGVEHQHVGARRAAGRRAAPSRRPAPASATPSPRPRCPARACR